MFLPWWAAERVLRRLARPEAVLIVRVTGNQQIVAAACASAFGAGVRPGLSLAHARAMLAGSTVHVEPADDRADAAGLLALARWIGRRWSPAVEVDSPDGILADITGCEHLFGGELRLVRSLERAVGTLRVTASVGVAGTVGAAWALARYGRAEDRIVSGRGERAAIAPLPVCALRLDPETVEALAEVGIDRIGQLMDLPRHALPARYGPGLLRRLDQALGLVPETVGRTPAGAAHEFSYDLPGGSTQLQAIEDVVRLLLDSLADHLAARESGLRRLDATFERLDDAEDMRVIVQVTRPTRDPRHLWSLLRPKVERVHMGFGIERITLRAGGVVRIAHRQVSLAGEQEHAWAHDQDFAATLDTLSSRIGRDRVLRAELVQSHRPEHAARLVPVDEPGADRPGVPARPWPPRPSRLIDPPSPAEAIALTPDGPVMQVRWRGGERRIIASIGPERIGPEWWKAREPARDYFRVQDDQGRWLWMFRDVPGPRWFVHGEWC